MEGFQLIQQFFTRMRCHFCTQHLTPESVALVREEEGVYVVNVHCTGCERNMGMALVGLEQGPTPQHRFVDPELTPEELERLSCFEPVTYDDVLAAHHFFQNLDADWQRHLPTSA